MMIGCTDSYNAGWMAWRGVLSVHQYRIHPVQSGFWKAIDEPDKNPCTEKPDQYHTHYLCLYVGARCMQSRGYLVANPVGGESEYVVRRSRKAYMASLTQRSGRLG